ncbi:hypothetical protein EV200_106229 [Pedobacter psychrotolerans]|uniref:Uncharacterized protein n=1 Tax=Pedobacter psychrotolerans TaxID=1843235 RepID=A0A4R2HBI1_9SPHI|nr:hypothetical protein [Pedobacter psychrotolerans]TCO22587.1 hypothetical protein EV200_106229 [Pedobacter psychrotolerans]GGE65691.1 hypothetical protein GCM10011413_35220 [Pedobacter psychrotolerans]
MTITHDNVKLGPPTNPDNMLTVPYSSLTTPLITSGFPFVANNGRFGTLTFEAGKSKLFLIRDKNNLITTTPRGTALSGELTDLSQFFQ